MDIKEAADRLDCSEYRKEGSKELFKEMEENNLVALFGASDDLAEFRGAIDDEVGCYSGGIVYVNSDGLLESKCEEGEGCPYFQELKQNYSHSINIVWNDVPNDFLWYYNTNLEHETFRVYETFADGTKEPYCLGIVFKLPNKLDVLKPNDELRKGLSGVKRAALNQNLSI